MSAVPESEPRRPPSALLWGLGVFLLALAIRLVGVGWGLPNDVRWISLHPDEPVVWAASQQVQPGRGDFDPGFYNYGTLYLSVLRVASDMVGFYGGAGESRTDEEQWRRVGRDHAAGRLISVLAGAATAWVVFGLVRRRTDLWPGLVAGLAVAFAPGHSVHSRFQTVDVFGAFLVAASLFYAVSLAPPGPDSPRRWLGVPREAWLAGLFAGLAAGTKYTGGLAVVSLWVVCAYLPSERLKSAVLGTVVAVLGFLIATPGVLLSWSAFARDFAYEISHTAAGHGLVFERTASGFFYHIANLSEGIGWLTLLFGVCGLALLCWRRSPWVLAIAAFALLFYIVIGRSEVKFFRYVLPLVPVLAVGVGLLFAEARERRVRWGYTVSLFIAIGLGLSLSRAAVFAYWMAGDDPRDQAGRYLKKVGAGRSVAVVSDPWFYTAPVFPTAPMPRTAPFELRHRQMLAAQDPSVQRYVPPNPDERYDWDVRVLESRPDYVVYGSFEANDTDRLWKMPGLPERLQEQVDRAVAFMKALREGYVLDKSFGDGGPTVHDLMYVHPTIWIWKRKTPSAKPSSGSSTTSGTSAAPPSTR